MMPPHLVLRDFLDGQGAKALLEYALARESAFAPTGVGEEAGLDQRIRVSVATRDLGPFKSVLRSKVLGFIPDLIAKLGMTPIESPKVELQLVAHNDGAFYKRHIDTQTTSDQSSIRVLSGVYYFHGKPKGFSGGALRLFAIGPRDAGFVDIEPEDNSLLVFPSWALHEVRPVTCLSKRFADSRFAINCWVYRTKTTQNA
jgi:Rps23 Pro-64 3,4-dihydroxylase Tpa1-like proline 4-hydroxylase